MSQEAIFWGDKRYHSLNYALRNIFGSKVMKLSLNGGFTCPNRDGTLDNRGCLFCGESGAGEFTASKALSIKEQLSQQISLLSKKWSTNHYIAYFQSFTNTYAPAQHLRSMYEEALSFEGVKGLAIATRPDCLPSEALDLLQEISKKTFLWIELGLQTSNEQSASLIRRGYSLDVYERAIEELTSRNIRFVVHLIAGLPYESKADFLSSIKYITSTKHKLWGIKLHLLHVLRTADLYNLYPDFHVLEYDEYIEWICDALELLPKETVIHRLTGDGQKEQLIAPKWSLNKLSVLSGIDKELMKRNSWQGKTH